jgi:cytochrome P450
MSTGTESRGGPPARAGVLDLLSLGATLGVERLKGKKSDPAAAGRRWADRLMSRNGGGDIDLPVVPIELVGNRAHSNELLECAPDAGVFQAGHTKTEAMSFLAPGALTIANGDAWRRLRPFNEDVLAAGRSHPFAQTFLFHVRAAFAAPVHNEADIRAAMGRAMVKIVLGDVSPRLDPARDIMKLFGAVQSPFKRKALGFLYHARRERLYSLIAHKWEYLAESSEGAKEETLLALAAHAVSNADRTTLFQQVPHWMFTFTGSGTDLLTRALCLISSRDDVAARALDEIHSVCQPDLPSRHSERGGGSPPARDGIPPRWGSFAALRMTAGAIGQMRYLEACILEAGRLFPPVTKTFHRASGKEYAHYFPLLQRDDSLGPSVHAFRPERWLEPTLDAPAAASNLFLRGPRACPGMDLILFVCKAAIARQLAELGVSAKQERLTRDPLPVSFPKPTRRFTASPR